MSRFLGIDIGTTFLKGAVLDPESHAVSRIHRLPVPDPVLGLPSTRYEIDASAILMAVRQLIGELLLVAPDATGLVMCSQMHCMVFLDDKGNPRSNVITWKDQRGLEPSPHGSGTLFDELKRAVTPEEQRQLGGEMRVGVPISTLYALKQRGELPARYYPASLPDFVLAKLCQIKPTTDPTLASAHGLFNVEKSNWHHDLIARLGFDGLHWPAIRQSGEVVGIAEIGGHRLTCFTPIGDQQCALLGVGLQEGELSLNISTGSQVSFISSGLPREVSGVFPSLPENEQPSPKCAPSVYKPEAQAREDVFPSLALRACKEPTATHRDRSGEFQIRPYLKGKWLRTIVSVPAGRSLGLLVDLLTEIGRFTGQSQPNPWEYIKQAVERIETTDLEVDLSFFSSITGDCGSITNIREGNLSVGHLFAAAFRTMATNYARCANILSPPREWNRVVFSGGLAQGFERLRKEILARLNNPPHRLCTTEEDTLAGLLVLAGSCI